MRALLPVPAGAVDLVAAYAAPPAPAGRPSVRCNMISTLDGAVTVGGRSGLLGGPADRRVFEVLRSVADVVVVGAGTVRTERYGPVRLDERLRQLRVARGQAPDPPIAVVTRSGDLEWSSPFFAGAAARPLVFTGAAAAPLIRARGEEVADVVVAGETSVEPAFVLDHLHGSGHRSVLLEGGPALNAGFAGSGLLDELCLTLSPRLAGGQGPRLLGADALDPPLRLETLHLLEEDGFLFLRLAVRPGGRAAPA